MADYKRFVSYMYLYTNGIKKKNVGYARVDTRNGESRLKIYLQTEGLPDGIFPTYLIHRPDGDMELIYIGDCVAKNQIMDGRLSVDENNVMNTGFKFSDIGGILLFLNTVEFYATQWDDKPIIVDDVLKALKPKPNKPEYKENHAGSKELTENLSAAFIDKESDLKNKTVEENQKQTTGTSDADKQADAEEILAGKQAVNDEITTTDTMSDTKADKEDKAVAESKEEIKEITAADNKKGEEFSDGAIREADKRDESLASGGIPAITIEKPVTVSTEAILLEEEKTEIDLSATKDEADKKEEEYAKEQTDYKEAVPASNMDNTNKQLSAGQGNIDNYAGIKEKQGGSQVPLYMLPRGYKIRERLGSAPYEKPINPWDQVDRFKRFEEDRKKAVDRLPQSKTQPDVNEGLKENQAIEKIFNNYPRIYPFEDNEIKRCVKIEPKDIGTLPSCLWNLSNNSFLLHGYYCYHHLIFAEISDRYGCRYIIGVPGIYHNRERFLARMFGFENFKSIRKRDLKQGDFGYWYQEIRL
ncbi:MAG TPA: DUF6128 domain-containing protein [Mobilitalea sp.]|nr:DUF6128 domain-containing protein [Mobilitalea sp.]